MSYNSWERGNLKLEGSNWFIVQIKRIYVLTFKSRHCNVYHRFLKYFITFAIIATILGILFALHFFVFFPNS
ncbi:MAG TPA: hypothetical protein PKY81_07555 [bacterium]|nr:hypothetical protein [bacterium]HPN30797.1 hypothetical protein [bacterium]